MKKGVRHKDKAERPEAEAGARQETAAQESVPEKCVTEDFLAHLLHDLKTPLITVKGFARRLQHEQLGPLTEEQAEAVAVILESCERLEYDLKMILEYARSARRTELQLLPEPFDLRENLTALGKAFMPTARRKNIALTLRLPPRPVLIQADGPMIDRAISNLLDNALKFTAPGGWVAVTLASKEEAVEVRVSDSGMGMEQSKIVLIFKPFEQVIGIADRELRGVGLGLANVKRYVELHRGTITVESEAGKGSTFIITLPKRQPA